MSPQDPNAIVDYNVKVHNELTKEPEEQATDFIPYRGHAQHGVAFHDPKNIMQYEPDTTTDEPFVKPTEPIEIVPIPVAVVETVSGPNVRLMTATSTFPIVAPTNGAMLFGQRKNRDRMTITNTGPASIYIGTDSSVNNLTGFIVLPNTTIEVKTTEDMYVTLDSVGVSAMIYLLEEYTILIGGKNATRKASHNRFNQSD